MKKTLLIVLALSMCHIVFSQRPVFVMGRVKPMATDEIKLNIATTLFSLPEISYERIWGNNLGLGLAARAAFTESYDTRYLFMPYCRFYFGEIPFKSFFTEVNIGIMGYRKDITESYSYNGTYNVTAKSNAANAVDMGVGIAFGYRYVNRYGLVSEIFAGIGRTTNDRIYSRCGVSMGKIF